MRLAGPREEMMGSGQGGQDCHLQRGASRLERQERGEDGSKVGGGEVPHCSGRAVGSAEQSSHHSIHLPQNSGTATVLCGALRNIIALDLPALPPPDLQSRDQCFSPLQAVLAQL